MGHDEVVKLMRDRKQRPVFFIDIADPRDIEPSVGEIGNVYLYNIDDLKFFGRDREIAFSFDSLRQRAMSERPLDLTVEPKAPDQMRYAELGHYVRTVERAGGDANKLKVERALKLAIPCTCLIIAMFGAPLGIAGGRSGAAYGVAVSLATTIVFLTMVQIMKAVGAGGVVPPLIAAWIPNTLFGVAGGVLFAKART